MTISDAIRYVGVNDTDIDLFESQYPVPHGVSYNSYLLLDDKIALLDTVDKRKYDDWAAKVDAVLDGRTPDYIVVHHLEPDHAGSLQMTIEKYPEATLVLSAKALAMLPQFFDLPAGTKTLSVKEGDTLELGHHTLTFVMAPMVHWPEVMVSYEQTEKVLFSADAFGKFGAVGTDEPWPEEARRYFINIVGKYGTPVQNVLKKAAGLDIQYLCPLHGPIWRENLEWFLEKYQRWSTYTPEDRGVAIFCGSIYGHTENAAEILAARLAERGVKNIALYDVSHTDVSYLVSEAFRCSHLVLASATYNGEIYTPMENFLRDLACHGLRGRSVALIENGTWAARSGMLMTKLLEEMKEMRVMEGTVTLKSSVKEAQRRGLESLADAIADELLH